MLKRAAGIVAHHNWLPAAKGLTSRQSCPCPLGAGLLQLIMYKLQTTRRHLHAGEKLASLVVGRAHTVLGWFVSRRAVWMAPSLRDRAVCEALPACLERLQAQFRNRQGTAMDLCGMSQILMPCRIVHQNSVSAEEGRDNLAEIAL